jgi:hypothetical protein
MTQTSLGRQTQLEMLPPSHTDQVRSRTADKEKLQKFVGTCYFLLSPILCHFFILLDADFDLKL